MTVLQQIRDYYTQQLPANLLKKRVDHVVTSDGVKPHPTPQDYFAGRAQKQDEGHEMTPSRLFSEEV